MDLGPVEALTLTGASRLQVFTHAVVPGVLPSLLGISLYRFDENIRSSLVLGFVGAGGIGFQLLTAMNLFQYQTVSLLLIMTFVIVRRRSGFRGAARKDRLKHGGASAEARHPQQRPSARGRRRTPSASAELARPRDRH